MSTRISLTKTINADLPLFKTLNPQTVVFKAVALVAELLGGALYDRTVGGLALSIDADLSE